MTSSFDLPDDLQHELCELIDANIDGRLTAEQRQRFESLLANNDAAVEFYVAYVDMHAELRWKRRGAGSLAVPGDTEKPGRAPSPSDHMGPFKITAALLALAAGVLIAVAIGRWGVAPSGPKVAISHVTQTQARQVGRWQITPTGQALFEVLSPALVRLERGELLIESTAPSDTNKKLRIETPHSEVSAVGTRFYVGHHQSTQKRKGPMFKPLTRVLVLSGVVTLTTVLGSVDGTPGELLTAEPGQAPTKHAVQANSDFAFDLYHQLVKENPDKNLFFSPYSISSALAMTAEGARGETAKEMGQVLRFPAAAKRVGNDAQRIPWETSLIHTGMAQLNRRLTGGERDAAKVTAILQQLDALRKQLPPLQKAIRAARSRQALQAAKAKEKKVIDQINKLAGQVNQYELSVANALWGEKTYTFKKEYFDTITKHYDTGGVFPCDYRNNFEGERARINVWVETKTNNRIKNLLPKGSLNRLTRLVLTNAVFFKGEWSTPFNVKYTKPGDFTRADGSKSKTALMNAPNLKTRYGAFNANGSFFKSPTQKRRGQKQGLYPKSNGFAMVELPYKGDDLSMVVIAPNDSKGLPDLEKKLTPDKVNGWVAQLKTRKTHVFLPKFKQETDYELHKTLPAMGMKRAFTDPRKPEGADFTGMSNSPSPMDRLYITKVLHKAFVEVNEKGTEAAAATAVVMAVPLSAPITVPFTPVFKADRPFIYLIRDKSSGSVLFLGRMLDPAAAK